MTVTTAYVAVCGFLIVPGLLPGPGPACDALPGPYRTVAGTTASTQGK